MFILLCSYNLSSTKIGGLLLESNFKKELLDHWYFIKNVNSHYYIRLFPTGKSHITFAFWRTREYHISQSSLRSHLPLAVRTQDSTVCVVRAGIQHIPFLSRMRHGCETWLVRRMRLQTSQTWVSPIHEYWVCPGC